MGFFSLYSSCPGLLNYNITREVTARMNSQKIAACRIKDSDGNGDQQHKEEDTGASAEPALSGVLIVKHLLPSSSLLGSITCNSSLNRSSFTECIRVYIYIYIYIYI